MKYLAYGSNLNIEQMTRRCPNAVPVGHGVLKNWRLVFRLHANIEPHAGGTVPFVVWEITPQDEELLDRYEGFPTYYVKRFVNAEYTDFDTGKTCKEKVMAYIMVPGREIAVPSRYYLNVIANGYEDFGLDPLWLKEAYFSSIERVYGKRGISHR